MLGIENAYVLLHGWHNHLPLSRILDQTESIRAKGMFRYLALSGHNRLLFSDLAKDLRLDILHIRYNVTHQGAEKEVLSQFDPGKRVPLVTYTATRWGNRLVNPGKMPPGEKLLRGVSCCFVFSNPNVDGCILGQVVSLEMREAPAALDHGPLTPVEKQWVQSISDYVCDNSWRMFFG